MKTTVSAAAATTSAADVFGKLTRYEAGHFASWYLSKYQEGLTALKEKYPHSYWAACRVPRRWAQAIVAERDCVLPAEGIFFVASTMESERIVACPQDDHIIIVGLDKPHAESCFCQDGEFFGACQWHTL